MATLNGNPVTLEDLENIQYLALTNIGHFTSMRCDDGIVRGLDLHMERLRTDCHTVFAADLDVDRVRGYVREAVEGRPGSFVIRVTIFDPGITMGHPVGDADPHVLVTTRGAGDLPSAPMVVQSIRFTRDMPAVKHMGLFSQLMRRRDALLEGFDDALFVGEDGRVTEGGTWNVGFISQEGQIIWPEGDVLPGVTMRLLQDLHPHVTQPVLKSELPGMRAAFATNTSIGVRTITGIDAIRYDCAADDPVLEAMRKSYGELPGDRL